MPVKVGGTTSHSPSKSATAFTITASSAGNGKNDLALFVTVLAPGAIALGFEKTPLTGSQGPSASELILAVLVITVGVSGSAIAPTTITSNLTSSDQPPGIPSGNNGSLSTNGLGSEN